MGWLMGAGVGFMLGGPLGAVVGGAMQHVMSGKGPGQAVRPIAKATGEQVFISNLVAIMTKISMADGTISESERKTIHNFFSQNLQYRGAELTFIDAMIDETRRVNPDLHKTCKSFDQFADKEQRLLLLDLVYQVAMADHVVTPEEKKAIDQVVSSLGIGSEEHNRIRSRFKGVKKKEHYATLGLDSSVGHEEVKKAYRQLASQYHPDKVSHLGPELIAFAQEKFKGINEAYATIRRERNI